MADIFISYSKKRRSETVALAADLQKLGYTVWWDTDLTPGEKYRDAINTQLSQAKASIVIWSPTSVKSDWVISEAERANKRGILIAVYTSDLDFDQIPQPFDVLHTAPLTDRAAILSALAKLGVTPIALGRSIDAAVSPQPDNNVKPITPAVSRRALIIGAGGIAAAGALGALAYVAFRPSALVRPIHTQAEEGQSVAAMTYTAEGHGLLTGSWDHMIRLWDVTTWSQPRIFEGHQNVVFCLAVLPNGQQAISGGDDGLLKLWDLTKPNPIRKFDKHTREVSGVAVMPRGEKLVSTSLDMTMKLWDIATATVLHSFEHPSKVLAVAVVPSGDVAISSAEDGIRAWNIVKLDEPPAAFGEHLGPVNAVAALPSGEQFLSVGDDRTLRVWNISSRNEIHRSDAHHAAVLAVAVSRDGRLALSGSKDRTAMLWDLSTLKAIRTFGDHGDWVVSVAIAPDGKTGATGSRNGTIRIWDLT